MGKRLIGIALQGRALSLIVIDIWPVIHSAGPSSNFNPCAASSMPSGNGFKGIDSTNRVTYVECLDYSILQSYECSDGSYFDEQSVQCVSGTWTNPIDSSSQTENICTYFYDGFVAIDASVYVECSNYIEIGRYSCPEGFYFDEGRQECTDKNASATASTSSSINSSTSENAEIGSAELVVTATCEKMSNGNIPLPLLQGWIVCDNGKVLVTEYCGASKLYNVDYRVCVNYCESSTSSSDAMANQVLLPKLAGQLTCDGDFVSDKIVCSPGTYFDYNLGYCRNFCENETNEYISFPNQQGGVACHNGEVISVEWCNPGSLYSTTIGVCMQTDAPSRSPVSQSPTIHIVTASPTISTASPFITPTKDATISPTLELELVVDVPDIDGEGKNSKPGLVEAEDNSAVIVSIRASLLSGSIISMLMLI